MNLKGASPPLALRTEFFRPVGRAELLAESSAPPVGIFFGSLMPGTAPSFLIRPMTTEFAEPVFDIYNHSTAGS